MKYILLLILPLIAYAQIVTPSMYEHPVSEPETYSKEDISELIQVYAAKWGVDSGDMYAIVKCETAHTFDPDIQSNHYLNGKREESYGLAQIHLPSHPYVTYEQAIDPHFALNFLGENMANNRTYLWSCARLLGIH